MATEMKVSPPWIEYYRKVEALFKNDAAVRVHYDDHQKTLRLFVIGEEKERALKKLLPTEKDFGGVVLKIEVYQTYTFTEDTVELFRKAFEGNKAFVEVVKVDLLSPVNYVVFKKEVVQFYNDNLGDVNGNKTTLYEDIARDVFGSVADVYFCTDKE